MFRGSGCERMGLLPITFPASPQTEQSSFPEPEGLEDTGGGVFLTTDYGSSWNTVNTGLTDSSVATLLVYGEYLFAGTLGEENQDDNVTDGGIFRSSDNGSTWSPTNNGLTNAEVYAFVADGTNLFSGTSTFDGNPGGVFRSTDSGNSWNAIDSGLPVLDVGPDGAQALAVSGPNILDGLEPDGQGIVYFSSNDGVSWNPSDFSPITRDEVEAFAVSGTNTFAATDFGVFLSTNNGISWITPDTDFKYQVTSFAVVGSDILAGTYYHGIFLSTNSGTSWTEINEGLTDSTILSITINGPYLFAGTDSTGVWRRPLSDFIPSSVPENAPVNFTNNLQVFPNPASDDLQIMGRQTGEVHLFDLLGREVLTPTPLVNGEGTLDVSHIESGMYFVRSGNESVKVEISH